MRTMNLAMLMKLGWKLITQDEVLWVKVLACKYDGLLNTRNGSNSSILWRHLRTILPVLEQNIDFSAGSTNDGEASMVSSYDGETRVRWKGRSTGKFDVASAYIAIRPADHHTHSCWSKIWRMIGPRRIHHLLWQVCHNFIPTKSFLQQRKISSDGSCDICGHPDENTMHALRDCRWASRVWHQHVFFRSFVPIK